MTEPEFGAWMTFYRHWPFDDLHRFHRPAAAVAAVHGSGDMKKLLDVLAPEPIPEGYSLADFNTLQAMGLTPPVKD